MHNSVRRAFTCNRFCSTLVRSSASNYLNRVGRSSSSSVKHVTDHVGLIFSIIWRLATIQGTGMLYVEFGLTGLEQIEIA